MIALWKGPKNQIGICDGMMGVGGIVRMRLLLDKDKDIVISIDAFDSETSLDNKWTRVSKMEKVTTKVLHETCTQCGQEIKDY